MRALILQGSVEEQVKYVDKLKSENKIPDYNIYSFEDNLKIAQAREIKNTLSGSVMSGGVRLVIIYMKVTLEAQNALLKTIEELPDDTFIVFLDSQDLLPTIFSRCNVVRLGQEVEVISDSSYSILKTLTGDKLSPSDVILLVDSFFTTNDKSSYEKLITSLRNELLLALDKNQNVLLLLSILKSLSSQLPLVTTNNLNPKLVVERAIIKAQSAL